MSSVFTKIIKKQIPAYVVAEDENHIAFLDINPIKKGHTLVVPKEEQDYLFDLEDENLSKLHLFSKKVSKGLKEAIPCKRIGMAVIGLEVPHVHLHLIPLDEINDLDFSKPSKRLKFSEEEMRIIAEKIKLYTNI